MKKNGTLLAGFALAVLTISPLQAETLSDTAKEQRWAEQVIDTLFDGEAIWLDAGGHEFLGIEMAAAEGDTGRAAIVVHGIGIHPNWDQVIRPLRVQLTEHGWHTLSIQMPILPNDADPAEYEPLFDEVTDRFRAAMEYLHAAGQRDLVVVAHSMGASMTMRFLADQPETSLRGVVLVGMNGERQHGSYDKVAVLETLTLPILDLYGSEDLPGVVQYAGRKANAAHLAGNRSYLQVEAQGANHFFDGEEQQLVNIVSGWLQELMAPSQ
jgi:pimeloyl-ACP methyl ester carboxylesterase